MAILTEMPSTAIISGYKGIVDYYLWMGKPIARRWPRSPGKVRAPAVEAQWPAFTYAAKEWNNLTPEIQAAYASMAEMGGLDKRDLQMRGYMSGLYAYPTP